MTRIAALSGAAVPRFRSGRKAVTRPYVRDARTLRQRALRLVSLLAICAIAALYGRTFVVAPQSILMLIVPLALMSLVIIWALPSDTAPPLKSLEACFFALLIVLVLWPNYLGMNLPGLPWITFARLTGVPMFLLFMVSLSVSESFRSDVRRVMSAAPLIWKSLAVFSVLQLLSLPFSSEPGSSIQRFALAQVFGTSTVVIAAFVALRPRRAELWAALFTLCIIPISIIAFLEWRRQQVIWAGHIPSFLTIDDPIVAKILLPKARAASGIYRVQGPSTTPLGLAEYLALASPFLVHCAVVARRMIVRWAAIAMMPIVFLVIRLTDSRLGVIGFGLSILAYALLWGAKRWRSNKASIVGPALTLSFPAVFVAVLSASFVFWPLRRVVWGSGAQQFGDQSRRIQIENGLPKVFMRPFGYGLGRAADTLGFTNLAGVLTIDSYFLSVALDMGVLGFITFLVLFGSTVALAGIASMNAKENTAEMLLAPLSISVAVFIVIKSIFSQDANHPMVFMMMGLIVALLYAQKQRMAQEHADVR